MCLNIWPSVTFHTMEACILKKTSRLLSISATVSVKYVEHHFGRLWYNAVCLCLWIWPVFSLWQVMHPCVAFSFIFVSWISSNMVSAEYWHGRLTGVACLLRPVTCQNTVTGSAYVGAFFLSIRSARYATCRTASVAEWHLHGWHGSAPTCCFWTNQPITWTLRPSMLWLMPSTTLMVAWYWCLTTSGLSLRSVDSVCVCACGNSMILINHIHVCACTTWSSLMLEQQEWKWQFWKS